MAVAGAEEVKGEKVVVEVEERPGREASLRHR